MAKVESRKGRGAAGGLCAQMQLNRLSPYGLRKWAQRLFG
jgi:hypothetical protein